jgi:hypothetical protein
MNIISLQPDNERIIQQAAQVLDAFRDHWPDANPTLEDGLGSHEMLK